MTGHWRISTPKMKYHAELFLTGPISTEARRLAKEVLRKEYAKKGIDINLASPKAVEKEISVLLYNAQEIFLRSAKWNLKL